jgi:putative transposase
VFDDRAVVESTLSDFVQSADAEKIAMAAYCFMPDHLHVLAIGLTVASDARRFTRSAKQRSGYRHAQEHGERLWQRYAWDRVLRSDEDTQAVLRYVLMNPVRAGLVEEPLEYPHSGSMVWSRNELAEIFKDGR